MNCPANKLECPCYLYAKEGLCDWPYKREMSLKELKDYRTEKGKK
jgi:hypothetical protein